MSLRTEVYWESMNKYGEELCGDKVEYFSDKKNSILVLADGLGSGVKANILSTLTTKIAVTMLKNGSSIEETVQTIASTLPVCKVRKIAYSTFTIIQVDSKGKGYVVEYGNPSVFFVRDNKVSKLNGTCRMVAGREIIETRLDLIPQDMLIVVSDGVVHAGVGGILNLGWQWKNIAEYIEKVSKVETSPKHIASLLTDVTKNFYMGKPGDDATVAALKIIRSREVTVFTGPPQDPKNDPEIVAELMNSPGQKVVCGGTAAHIVSRILNQPLDTTTTFIDPQVPPTAKIKGIDLVTEGVLTLDKAREIIKRYVWRHVSIKQLKELQKEDGASRLAKILLDATDITFLLGKAINPAHQNPDFPRELSIKNNIVKDLIEILNKMGKTVKVKYF